MLSERIRDCIGTVDEWADDAVKLARVARAAEEAWPFMFEDIPKALNSKRAKYERLNEALADLPEDALGG